MKTTHHKTFYRDELNEVYEVEIEQTFERDRKAISEDAPDGIEVETLRDITDVTKFDAVGDIVTPTKEDWKWLRKEVEGMKL